MIRPYDSLKSITLVLGRNPKYSKGTIFAIKPFVLSFARRRSQSLLVKGDSELSSFPRILFIALWILSIFGNYGDMDSWHRAQQIELFHWSLLFGMTAVGIIFVGLKYDDAVARSFGIVFLFINLYTRYFEYF